MTRVTLYGTRGSVASPGPETAGYGGNTSTVEVCGSDGTLLVLDAGTGIRRLGQQVPRTMSRIDILLTHLHMDHIQGLGFFAPLYNPAIEIHIWGPSSSTLSLEARLSRYLSPPLFPVHLRDLPRLTCHQLPYTPFEIGRSGSARPSFATPDRPSATESRRRRASSPICRITSLPLASETGDGRGRSGSRAMILRSIPIF